VAAAAGDARNSMSAFAADGAVAFVAMAALMIETC